MVFRKRVYGVSEDPTYGFEMRNPIRCGGGPAGERLFLENLLLPGGEEMLFERLGSVIVGEEVIDRFLVFPADRAYSLDLFLDMYRHISPKTPAGFQIKTRAKKPPD